MRSGLLTDKIAILEPKTEKNEYAEEIQTYALKCYTRARVVHSGGKRDEHTNELDFIYNKTFEVYYYVNINDFDRICWADKYYRVLSVEPIKEQNKKVILTELVNE